MQQIPLECLACPDCRSAIAPAARPESFARCPACGRNFAREGRVYDMAPRETAPLTGKTVSQFGASWQIHSHVSDYHDRQFRDWISPLTPEAIAGKTVLEAGCGKGRHSLTLAGWRPAALFSLDLSDAVVIAAEYTKDLDNAYCVRANLLKLPLAPEKMDIAICVGVLHHLEDPEAGLRQLWDKLKPGGTLCLWVYGREGNGWIVYLLDPIRKGITSRIPTRWLRPLLWPLSVFLFLLLKCLYGPLSGFGKRPAPLLPYGAYLGYISKFPFREIEHIVLDHLCPPVAYYLSKETLQGWFAKLGVTDAQYRWHNRNSWNIVARKPAPGA